MQRLFSTFAGGPPGAGLFIQRLLIGAALLYVMFGTLPGIGAPQVIAALAGILLICGLWTPVAGVVAAIAESWITLLSPAHPPMPALLAVLSVTLALIGPGEWSIDARLYGRKHLPPPEI